MTESSKDELIAVLKKKPAERLFTSCILTLVVLSIVTAVMGMDAISAEKFDKLANYSAAAIGMIAIGLGITWFQVRRINKRLEAVAELLSSEKGTEKETGQDKS
ncbi:MAG: hypothetical protein AB7W16_19905 [Candidatus Obscuribacterales bacterium]